MVWSEKGSSIEVLPGSPWGFPLAQTAVGRLDTVSSGGSSASYSYLANGEAVREITLRNGQMPRLVNTWERDDLGRIRQAKAAAATGPSLSRAYEFDALNRCKEMALEDGSRWAYDYDGRGQVTEGKRYWSAGQSEPVAGQQFGYNHDAAGNRATVQAPGASTYTPTANRFNQYASRTVPQNLSVVGTANPSASVTVNGAAAARHGAYFQADVPAGNGTGPAWKDVAVQVSRQDPPGSASQTGHSLVPAASESFVYDDEGNLTQDSVWQYEWDAENRLTGMTLKGMTPAPAAKRIEFQYDWQGRRIAKRVYDATTGGNQLAASVYVYDGWNLIGVLDGSGNLRQTFVWGLDVSGTEQGAGGVGGLLWLTDGVGTAQERTAFCGYDASGNVIALVQATDPLLGARYEYGPFGEVIRMTGPLASANPFRFSTKYTDDETGLLYYGYRYYSPKDGRWLSKDPIGEAGGINLYAFCENDPVNRIDTDGRGALAAMDVAAVAALEEGGFWNGTRAAGIHAGKAALIVFSLGTICKNDRLADLATSGEISDAQFWTGSAMNTGIGLGSLAVGGGAANLAARAGGGLIAQGAASGFSSSLTDVVATRCGDALIDIRYEGTIASDLLQVGSGTLAGGGLGGAARLRQVWAGGASKSGVLALTKSEAPLIQAVPRQPGVFDIGAHGAPNSIVYGPRDSTARMSASDLAGILSAYKGYQAQNLRLFCCCTGKGVNSFGSQLARRTWVVVEAPTEKVWLYPGHPGHFTIQGGSGYPSSPLGQWMTFSPFNVYFPANVPSYDTQ